MKTSSIDLIDRAIARTRVGALSMQSLLWVFASRVVLVGSSAEVGDDLSGFQPVVFERDGEQLVAVFTTTDRADLLGDSVPYLAAIAGEDLVRRLPDGFGIVVNPRSELGFEVPARGIAAFRSEIST